MKNLTLTSPHTKGPAVKAAQKTLKKHGYYGGKVDGVFGPVTVSSVRRAKYYMGYAPGKINGVYGPTLDAFLKGTKKLPKAYVARRKFRLKAKAQQAAKANKRKLVLAAAVAEIGTKESPAGSNRVKYTEWYNMVGPWCHPAGTFVKMADGTHKPIEGISVGDWVYTAEGNASFVTAVGNRKAESLKEVAFVGGRLRLTPEHPILTERGYVRADEITEQDRVAIPRIHGNYEDHFVIEASADPGLFRSTFSLNKQAAAALQLERCPSVVTLDADFGRLVGLYLAEGSTRINGRNKGELKFSFGAGELHFAEETVALLESKLGAPARIVDRRHIDSTYDVIVYGRIWVDTFRELCGTGSPTKFVSPALMNAPAECIEATLWGWMDGDGWLQAGTFTGTTTSKRLAFAMFDLANSLGYAPCLRPRKSHAGRRQAWDVSFRDPNRVGKRAGSPVDDSATWRKVRRVDDVVWNDSVYNLSVSGDESYIADGVGVHNCAMFTTWAATKHAIKSFNRLQAQYAYVPYMLNDAIAGRNGLYVVANPLPGDLVIFNWDKVGVPEHVGFFEEWTDRKGGNFTSVEGNTSFGNDSNGGAVMRRDRNVSQGVTFVRYEV